LNPPRGARWTSDAPIRRLLAMSTLRNLLRFWAARKIVLAAAALAVAAVGPARALDVGPKTVPLKVAGVLVEIPVSASLDMHTEADALAIKASAIGDLQAIQDNALAIARGLRLPHEPCKHNGVNVVVNSIDAAKITPVKASVVIDLSGHVALYACTKVLGQPLKTKLAEDSVSLSAPVELYLPTPSSVALRLAGTATITTGKPATMEAASAFLGDVNAALSAQLAKLLDTERARAAAPSLPGLDVDIESAGFAEDSGKLTVRAKGRATMSSAAFASLMDFLAH
jgi:hypothetical protein